MPFPSSHSFALAALAERFRLDRSSSSAPASRDAASAPALRLEQASLSTHPFTFACEGSIACSPRSLATGACGSLCAACSARAAIGPRDGESGLLIAAPPRPVDDEHVDIEQTTIGHETDIPSFLAAPDRARLAAEGVTTGEVAAVSVDGAEYVLPPLFGIVERGVYRCGFPTPESFTMLAALRLKTVVNLLDRVPPEYKAFLAEQRIAYVHAAVKGNKVHCEEMDRGVVAAVLAILVDTASHPVLIHCRSGKHRTGALVGCLRMLQRWPLERACDEYVDFTRHKQRAVDKQYIERFRPRKLRDLAPPPARVADWLGHDAWDHDSALEEAIARGELQPELAEVGLAVSAIGRAGLDDEPGFTGGVASFSVAAELPPLLPHALLAPGDGPQKSRSGKFVHASEGRGAALTAACSELFAASLLSADVTERLALIGCVSRVTTGGWCVGDADRSGDSLWAVRPTRVEPIVSGSLVSVTYEFVPRSEHAAFAVDVASMALDDVATREGGGGDMGSTAESGADATQDLLPRILAASRERKDSRVARGSILPAHVFQRDK